MLKPQREALAKHILALSDAAETEVIISCDDLALTRFTHENVHQNVASDVTSVRVRLVHDNRVGVATTNGVDDASLKDVVARAMTIARFSPRDESWPGLPQGGKPAVALTNAYVTATAEATAQQRATTANDMFAVSEDYALWGAGYVSTTASRVTIANSHGRLASYDATDSIVNIKQNGVDATGYAEAATSNFAEISGTKIASIAAKKASDTANPQAVAPGKWTVILEPVAFAELLSYFVDQFSAQSIEEGSSFIGWDAVGSKVTSANFTLRDDWTNVHAPGMPFDYEGTPRQSLALLERGVVTNAVTDSRWAARLSRANTGHALPAPNSSGPQPLYTCVDPGTQSLNELIGSVERGLFISRFWYIRTVDRRRTIVTGMTRDGTYLIENGKLNGGVHNLRFNQSILGALQNITLSNEAIRTSGLGYTMVVPAAKIEDFAFSSSTSF
jgi:PmbA protein